jgi:DtxR family Mn-dependent transcriptional regulator
MYSQAEENYLKSLFNFALAKGEVNVNELSKQLDIKMPTVNSMIKRLAAKNLVIYERYQPIKLTEKGKKEASLIIRKHRLTEMFLVEKMGFGWEQVHNIAEQVEHVQSIEFFDKIDELLGYPTVDPHGSSIPDKEGKMAWLEYTKLSDCKVGETVRLVAVTHSSADFLIFLNSRELHLGTILKIKAQEAFDKTITVSYDKRKSEMLSQIVCDKLLVEQA